MWRRRVSSLIISKATGQVLVPYNPKFETLIPEPIKTLEHQDQTYAILPHDPPTQHRLRAAGVEIPAPILFHYDWASSDGAVPFQIQKDTASLATSYQRSYILNDMGTGKTKASLWAWRYLFKIGVAQKLLV